VFKLGGEANRFYRRRDSEACYKVDTDAIALKVKQEFAAKEKAKKAVQPVAKVAKKAA
jgi:ParB family chromosome partitioning protein